MINYYFLAIERINSLYNQLATSTPVEIITKQSNKKWTLTEGKLGAEGGLIGFIKGTVGISRSANKENAFEENVRSSVEREHTSTMVLLSRAGQAVSAQFSASNWKLCWTT